MPWILPPEGAEIVVPYNLRYIASEKDNIVTIAQKFTEKEKAWMLDQYNKLKGQPIRRGDEVLIPLTNLPLTDAGRAEAAAADAATRTQAHGVTREAQRRVDLDMPVLLADVRGGRYVDAVTLGGRLLGMGELTKLSSASSSAS